jgi:hypothetical protein
MFTYRTNAIHAGYSTRKSPKFGYLFTLAVILLGTFIYIL